MGLFSTTARPWVRGNPGTPYPGGEPCFYDPADFPWVAEVEAQWETIRDELLAQLEKDNIALEPYKDLSMVDKPEAWKTAGLMYWTFESDTNIARFPKTWEILKNIPSLTSCSLLALEPGSTVKPHNGDTNAMVRCHMGLVVPAALPKCGLRVGEQSKSWEEGKIFMFNDAHLHTAWNNSDQCRYILSFDVMRPEFGARRRWVSIRVLGQIFQEISYQNHRWLGRHEGNKAIDGLTLAASRGLFKVLMWLRLPLYNLL